MTTLPSRRRLWLGYQRPFRYVRSLQTTVLQKQTLHEVHARGWGTASRDRNTQYIGAIPNKRQTHAQFIG
jgi:hypothetical protein